MFARLIVSISLLAALVVASPMPQAPKAPLPTCSAGILECCASIDDPNDLGLANIIGDLIPLPEGLKGPVGTNCVPIVEGSAPCLAQLACCSGQTGVLDIFTLECVPGRVMG